MPAQQLNDLEFPKVLFPPLAYIFLCLTIVSETISGAFLLSAAQCAFVNQMVHTLAQTAPNVDPAAVIATGATEIRDVFAADQVPGIVIAYMDGIRIPFAIATGAAGAAFVLSCIVGWKVSCPGARKAVRGGLESTDEL